MLASSFVNGVSALDPRAALPSHASVEFALSAAHRQADDQAPFDVIDGVAVIEIAGTLLYRTGCTHPVYGFTGLDGIRQALREALRAPAVGAIALDVDCHGGELAGVLDLADEIRAARGEKPIWAICTENATAGAYAIASAADRVLVPRTGLVGGVGLLYVHADLSGALDKAGITVTVVQFGAHKSDFAPFLPLGEGARQRFQAKLDYLGGLFVETVARNRGLSAARIRAQESATYMGAAAVAAGLADDVMAPDEALAALARLARRRTHISAPTKSVSGFRRFVGGVDLASRDLRTGTNPSPSMRGGVRVPPAFRT